MQRVVAMLWVRADGAYRAAHAVTPDEYLAVVLSEDLPRDLDNQDFVTALVAATYLSSVGVSTVWNWMSEMDKPAFDTSYSSQLREYMGKREKSAVDAERAWRSRASAVAEGKATSDGGAGSEGVRCDCACTVGVVDVCCVVFQLRDECLVLGKAPTDVTWIASGHAGLWNIGTPLNDCRHDMCTMSRLPFYEWKQVGSAATHLRCCSACSKSGN